MEESHRIILDTETGKTWLEIPEQTTAWNYPDLLALGREVVAINTANGWNCATPEDWGDQYKVPALLALITSEVSEALEGFRNDDRENFIEEMADVVIRVLDCTTGLGMDIQAAITAKLEKNRKRGYRHGGKRV